MLYFGLHLIFKIPTCEYSECFVRIRFNLVHEACVKEVDIF